MCLTTSAEVPRRKAIAILPSTTRWKPQRSVSKDITVNFKGPSDLDPATVRLEVTTPGGPSNYEPIRGPVSKVQGTQDRYTFDWVGPWTYELNGKVLPMPRGNYKLVVAGKRQGSETEIKSDPPYEKVSLVEVTDLEFFQCSESVCGKLGTNGNAGGGSAMYPDAAAPGGLFRRQIGVRAKTDPPLSGEATDVAVYFRAIDADDPSASTAPVDAETPSATPENPAADNYGECAGPSDPCVAPAVTGPPVNASDVSEALFFVSPYPGVNYRIAASTSATWLTDLRGKLSSTVGDVEHFNGTPLSNDPANNEIAQVSDMLTVWRVLNLELKRMDPDGAGVTQDQIQHNGTWTDIKKGKVVHKPDGIQDADHPDKDDWVGAYLRPAVTDRNATEIEPGLPDGKTVYFVDDSKKDSASVEGSLEPFLTSANKKYYLRDDELTSLTTRQHDLTFITDLLKPAYITVDTQYNPVPLVSWDTPLADQALNAMTRLPNNASGWSVAVVLAFEAAVQGKSVFGNQHDLHRPPNVTPTSGVLGLACGGAGACYLPGDNPIAATFTETIRDFAWTDRTSIKPTVPADEIYGSDLAHEVLHTLGLWHNGGIMCSTRKNYVDDPMRYKITDLQLSLLRKLERPHVVADKWDSCDTVAAPNCCPDAKK